MTPRSVRCRTCCALAAALALTLAATCASAQSDPLPTDPVEPAPPTPSEIESARFGYDENGLFAESADGRYRFRLSNQLQPQFEFVRADGGSGDDETNARFLMRRVRTTMRGNVFSKAVRYKVQVDWGRGRVVLLDAVIDFHLDPDWFAIKVGQFKVPSSRQALTSSSSLELVDRAITDAAFLNQRDLGFAFHNGLDKPFEYSLGLYNGTSERARFQGSAAVDADTLEGPVTGAFTNVPDTFRPLLAARVGSSHGDIGAYSEGDLERGPFGFGVGLSGYYELDVDEDDETTAGGTFDFITKVAGFSLTGAASLQHFETDEGDENRYGGFVQSGFAFAGGELATFQPAARYAIVVDRDGDRLRHEAGGGLSVYFSGHRLKLQTDAFALIDQDDTDGLAEADAETVDVRLRAQLQLLF